MVWTYAIPSCALRPTLTLPKTNVSTTLITQQEKKHKKTQLVQSLAPALTLILTLTFNHLANKPQRMTSTLFSLMYQVHDGLLYCEYSIDDVTATWTAVKKANSRKKCASERRIFNSSPISLHTALLNTLHYPYDTPEHRRNTFLALHLA